MNINRNNYEEFFLLYIDGELSPQHEEAVNVFLLTNPDLQVEFDELLDSKLVADDVLIFDKSSLYKNEETAINSSNYEENFLLYVDNELNGNMKVEVEKFVLQNPSLQQNFTSLKNTILPIEQIVCPNKESLYKKEEKPVIFMWVKRFAVAAAILLFAVMAWVFTNKTNQPTTSTASVKNSNNNKKSITPTVTSTNSESLNIENNTATAQPQKMPIVQPNETIEKRQFVKNINPKNTIVQPVIIVTPQQSLANSTPNKINIQKDELDGVINTNIKTNNPMNVVVKTNNIESATIQTVNKTQALNNTIHNTVYKTLEEDDDDITANNTIYVGNMQLNKNKVDGLLKKAKSLFTKSKRSKNQDSYIATVNTL